MDEFNEWVRAVNEEERREQLINRWRKKNMPRYNVGSYEDAKKLGAPLRPGVYECEVYSGSEKTSATGTPMFSWELRVVNNEDPDVNGTPLFYNTPLKGKGKMFLQDLYEGCGLKWVGSEVDLPEDLLGRACMVSVNNYVFEGVERHGVKSILPKN